jgi:hypothetical protein
MVTRRGFLSLCFSLPVIAKIPEIAEPIIQRPSIDTVMKLAHNSLYGKIGSNFPRVARYTMALGHQVVEPGRVALLRARPSVDLVPERLLINEPGFELLHLRAGDLEPLSDVDGIPSDVFTATAYYRVPMEYAKVTPEDEVILALINRNDRAVNVAANVIGAAKEQDIWPTS